MERTAFAVTVNKYSIRIENSQLKRNYFDRRKWLQFRISVWNVKKATEKYAHNLHEIVMSFSIRNIIKCIDFELKLTLWINLKFINSKIELCDFDEV